MLLNIFDLGTVACATVSHFHPSLTLKQYLTMLRYY
jgi:hypothetical protein